MNYKKNLTLGILALTLMAAYPLLASPCPTGNPSSLAYIYRDRNRCEGIKPREISQKFDLIAFSMGSLSSYPKLLKIRIPKTQNKTPDLTIQSFVRNYLLDNLTLKENASSFSFELNPKTVLEKANIPPQSLRATASTLHNSRNVYYPVIFGQGTKYYDLVVFSATERTFSTVEIRRQDKVIPSNLKPSKIPKSGEIFWRWEYGNAPAGTYELYLKDEQGEERSFYLEHDPKWL
ncbi:MAG: hypothetical protein RLZZ148_2662 [Cyanobacteriota bacterium]